MNKMNRKLNVKGFTLAELLIVVAIIAVLVAVSVPIFSSKLEKAREATDVANMRAAKAAAVTQYLSDQEPGDYYYDAEAGILKRASSGIHAYGQGTGTDGGVRYNGYDNTYPSKGNILLVTIGVPKTDNGEPGITMKWLSP